MADWDFSYNGLTFTAAGTLVEIDGADMPAVRSSGIDRAGADGAVSGIDTYDTRKVVLVFDLATADAAAWETLLDTYRRAFNRQSADLPFVADLPGQVAKRLYCRPRRRKQPIDKVWAYYGTRHMLVELVADDPLFYAETATVTDLNPGGGAVAIPNAGDEATKHWSAVIVGPATSPVITHANGTVLDFTGYVLGAAQTITLDGRAFTAVRETGADVRGSLTSASDFFTIAAGGETLTFTASGTTGATDLDVTTRAAWASLT